MLDRVDQGGHEKQQTLWGTFGIFYIDQQCKNF